MQIRRRNCQNAQRAAGQSQRFQSHRPRLADRPDLCAWTVKLEASRRRGGGLTKTQGGRAAVAAKQRSAFRCTPATGEIQIASLAGGAGKPISGRVTKANAAGTLDGNVQEKGTGVRSGAETRVNKAADVEELRGRGRSCQTDEADKGREHAAADGEPKPA